MTADDPVAMVMQDIHYTFFTTARSFGVPAALEGLANVLIINLAAAYGEKGAMKNTRRNRRKRDPSRSSVERFRCLRGS